MALGVVEKEGAGAVEDDQREHWLDAGQAISKCSEHQNVEQAPWLVRAQRTACCHCLPDCYYEMVPDLDCFMESQ